MPSDRTLEEPVFDDAVERSCTVTRRVHSSELLAGRREIIIRHAGENYYLRLTSKGRLILTK